MNKRQKKKLSRNACPRCKRGDGIWSIRELRTGRYVSDFVQCLECGYPESLIENSDD